MNPREICRKFHPEARMLVGYIPCSPFVAEVCSSCGSVVTYWGFWKTLAWRLAFGWWWWGEMTVFEAATFPSEWRKP